jgi:hypothetical protein
MGGSNNALWPHNCHRGMGGGRRNFLVQRKDSASFQAYLKVAGKANYADLQVSKGGHQFVCRQPLRNLPLGDWVHERGDAELLGVHPTPTARHVTHDGLPSACAIQVKL